MTTAGYGDVVPVTPIRKMIAAIIMLFSIGLAA